MALSYNLGNQESISVHPTRRQIFAGKPYSTFPNIWEWLIYVAVFQLYLLWYCDSECKAYVGWWEREWVRHDSRPAVYGGLLLSPQAVWWCPSLSQQVKMVVSNNIYFPTASRATTTMTTCLTSITDKPRQLLAIIRFEAFWGESNGQKSCIADFIWCSLIKCFLIEHRRQRRSSWTLPRRSWSPTMLTSPGSQDVSLWMERLEWD